MRMAARRLTQFYDAALAGEGVTVSQYSILATIARAGATPPNVNALAETLAMDRSTLGHNLRPLARERLVALVPDPDDRRNRRVSLTRAGAAKLAACRPIWDATQRRFDERFGREDSAALRRTLSFIARDLDLGEAAALRSPKA